MLSLSELAALDEGAELARPGAAERVGELERPEEAARFSISSIPSRKRGRNALGDLLEVRSSGRDLVDDILDRDDSVLSESALDDGVGGQGDALLVDLAVSALVDELADGLEVGLSAGARTFSRHSWGTGGRQTNP